MWTDYDFVTLYLEEQTSFFIFFTHAQSEVDITVWQSYSNCLGPQTYRSK